MTPVGGETPSNAAQAALAAVAAGLGRVLDLNPAIIRLDTPLADIGCDSVAVIAVVDVLAEDHGLELDATDDRIDQAVLSARTVGDLVRAAELAVAPLPLQPQTP